MTDNRMEAILAGYQDDSKWDGARYEHIKRISNGKVGDVGQDYIEKICEDNGVQCEFPIGSNGKRARTSPWDIRIGGITFELKTATEDVSGAFQFNHIRYHREYEALICLGVAPDCIYFNIWSKADVATGKAGRLVSMEKSGNASHKLTKRSDALFSIDDFIPALTQFVKNFS
jgi:hypothetical protein